jgi:preprotein translocase subunit YajC
VILLLATRLTHALPDAPAAAPGAPQGGLLQMLPLMLIMGAGFYLFIIMPGNKQRKQQQEMIDNLKVGDRVLLSSGMYGRVHQLKDDTLTLRVAEGVHVEFAKSAISKVILEEQAHGK